MRTPKIASILIIILLGIGVSLIILQNRLSRESAKLSKHTTESDAQKDIGTLIETPITKSSNTGIPKENPVELMQVQIDETYRKLRKEAEALINGDEKIQIALNIAKPSRPLKKKSTFLRKD